MINEEKPTEPTSPESDPVLVERMEGIWIYEIPELEGLSRQEFERVRAYLRAKGS